MSDDDQGPKGVPLHILRRIAELGTVSEPVATPDGEPVPAGSPTLSRRRSRMAREGAEHWRIVRARTLHAIVELRTEVEPGLQSPDLTSAALFMVPNLDQVPAMPEGKRPDEDDRSDAAEEWRAQYDSRQDALEMRRRGRRGRQMKPYQTWRNLGSAGERGGIRAFQRAWPPSWNSYLNRIDPDGLTGDTWSTPLGVAFKRIERLAGEKALPWQMWEALRVYTEPAYPYDIKRVEQALHVQHRQALHWVEAGVRRIVADMRAIGFGRDKASVEYREAEESEARAWQE